MKFILIVIDEKRQTLYFGPFNDGEEALTWGEQKFNKEHFLMSTTLYSPNEKKK